MVAIRLKGYITETGSIEVEIPKDFPAGEVMLTIEAVAPDEEQPLTEAEILELMHPNPKTGAEIAKNPAIGSWADLDIVDSVEWLAEQRRKRKEINQW